MKTFLFLLSLFCLTSLNAQINFQRTFGTTNGEQPLGFVENNQKEIFVLGSTYLNLNLVKLDSLGNLIWSKQLPVLHPSFAQIHLTDEGGFILCGRGDVNDETINYILKLNEEGEKEWLISFEFIPYFHVNDIIQTLDGGYIAVGGGLIIKLNSEGALLWKKIHISTTADNLRFASIQQIASDSSFIVSGSMVNDPNTIDTVTISKLSKNGEPIWNKLIPNIFGLRNVQILENNHLVLFCRSSILELEENGEFISKIDIEEFYTGSIAKGVKRNNYYLLYGGYYGQYAIGEYDLLLSKIDIAGNVLWTKLMGGILSENYAQMSESIDHGSIILGATESFSIGANDYYLIKTDSLETLNCNTIPFNLTTTTSFNTTTIDFGTTVETEFYFYLIYPDLSPNQSISFQEHDACDCIDPIAQFEFYSSGSIIDHSIWSSQSTFYILDSNNVLVNNFSYDGTYTVCLHVENDCGTDSTCQVVEYYYQVVSLEEKDQVQNKIELSVVNNQQMKIHFQTEQVNSEIRLIDLMGKEVKNEKINGNDYLIDTSNMNDGMYFIQIDTANNVKLFRQKIMIHQ